MLYLRGLMADGRRKSMQPMAERLGIDHQRLQQFIISSTWDYTEVRHAADGEDRRAAMRVLSGDPPDQLLPKE